MRYLYLFVVGFLILASCQENEHMVYTEKPAVYFPNYVTGADSMLYSFRIKGCDIDTINLNVKLLGALLDEPGKYEVKVSDNSTAVAGKHYVALPEVFEFGADVSTTSFPVVLLKPGAELDDSFVTLELFLVATDDLDTGYPDHLRVRLIMTNELIKPSYWDDLLNLYFGEYSVVKHQQCILIMGHDFPLTKNECSGWGDLNNYSYWMQQGRVVCEYYATHTVYDENGNLITVWNPF